MLSTLDAARRNKSLTEKLLPRSIYDVLTQISNDFQWSLYRVQCRQILAVAARRGVFGVDTVLLTYWEETKQPRRPIAGLPLLEFSPALESWSDIYRGPISCLIVLQTFSSFVFYSPSLSFCRSAQLFTECSLLHIMSRYLLLIGYKFVLVLGPDSVF